MLSTKQSEEVLINSNTEEPCLAAMSTPTTTLLTYNSRRLLQLLNTAAAAPPAPQTLIDHHHNFSNPYAASNSFDANVIMVLSVLLCALICSLGLNSIIKCALRCSSVDTSSASNNNSTSSAAAARLANTGVKRKALKTFPTVTYSADLNLPGLDTECVICLSEFSNGDKVRLLPKCNHGFHVRCIDKWLGSHSSCPTCRHCLIETCHKIVGSSSSELPPPHQETIINVITIAPLQPEGLIRNYR